MDKAAFDEYVDLSRSGLDLDSENKIKANTGSETVSHLVAKALAFKALRDAGYQVESEVTVSDGEIDLVAYGLPERLSYAVEVETSPSKDTMQDKVDRYVSQTGLDDMLVINVTEMSVDIIEAYEYVQEELGLQE